MSAPRTLTAEEFARAFAEIHPPFDAQEAVVEANRCLYCFDAPCTSACPTHIDVPRFIKKIASGNLRGSAETILDANVLGLSCSRVCPVDVLCEGACVMHRYNKKPIEIGRLQRRAMDYFYSSGAKLPLGANGAKAKRVACAGAGPASLACAAELRRRGYAVTIFESRPLPGGLNTYGVAEYKLRPPDSLLEVELIRSLGVEFRTGVTIGQEVTLDELEKDYDAVFIGVGLGPAEKLNIPGENLAGVIDAMQFIAKYKTMDPMPAGQRIVVIGGGNTAIDAAVASRLLGAGEVTITYRRGEADMPAFAFEYELAKTARRALPLADATGRNCQRGRAHSERSEVSSHGTRPDGHHREAPAARGPGIGFSHSMRCRYHRSRPDETQQPADGPWYRFCRRLRAGGCGDRSDLEPQLLRGRRLRERRA